MVQPAPKKSAAFGNWLRRVPQCSLFKLWTQYVAALFATLAMVMGGTCIGWTSPIIPKITITELHLNESVSSVNSTATEENLRIQVSKDEASWIVSFLLLGAIPGNLIAGFVVDRIGRKLSLILVGIPFLISWLLIILANSDNVLGAGTIILYSSRLISGIGTGMAYVLTPIYIGEIADKNIRGCLGTFIKLMVTFGELYGHAIGPYVSYDVLAYSCIVIPIIYFLTFTWMPESPYYLLMKGRREESKKSLKFFNRTWSQQQIDNEVDQIYKAVINDLNDRGECWDLFSTPGNRRSVLISVGLQIVLQLSGICAIESYTQDILAESGFKDTAARYVILLSLLQLIAGVFSSILVDQVGRRPLLLITTFLAGVVLTISCVFCMFKYVFGYPDISDPYATIYIYSVIGYELIIALGLNPLPYMMLGELFSTSVKGYAVCFANLWASLLAFIASKMYQVITDNFGIYTTFGWFASTCVFGLVFITFFVPETKGKSLLEIQEELNVTKKSGNCKRKSQDFKNDVFTI